jgi:hypothetical protein
MTGSGLTAGAGIAVGTRTTVAEDCTDEKCPLEKKSKDTAELIYNESNSAIENIKEGLKTANEDVHCEYKVNDNDYLVMMAVDCDFGFDGSGCGRTDYSYGVTQTDNYAAKMEWEVSLSNDDTEDAVSYLRAGHEIFSVLSSVLPVKYAHGAILFVAAVASGYTANKLESANDGCGVEFEYESPEIKPGEPMDSSWKNDSDLNFWLHTQQG